MNLIPRFARKEYFDYFPCNLIRKPMQLGILKEPAFENRVSMLPETVAALTKQQVQVVIEQGAGLQAWVPDEAYQQAGATVVSREEALASQVVLSIQAPEPADIAAMKPDTVLVGLFQPLFEPQLMQEWALRGLVIFSMDFIPRTTRAQSMDVLSSQANIAGYKAVLTAANAYPHYFPMFMTAAGSIAPAKVLILGAGVAGLQAIATAKRLGAVVEVFDTRPAVKEEVMSLGAKFVEVEGAADASKAGGYAVEQNDDYQQRQQQKIKEHIIKSDVVITTAQIPGKRAPLLVTDDMIAGMKPGSVIVDIAAATGGNTAGTRNNETVIHHGVIIIGNSALPSAMPNDASKLYGKNVFNFLKLMLTPEGGLSLNFEDDIVKGTCIAHQNQLVQERVLALLTTGVNA
jgi:NAD(P) transhydrogenase subunit alpha